MPSLRPEDEGGHLPRASAGLPVLPHKLLATRVLDSTNYVLPWLQGTWVGHGTHRYRGPLACNQEQLLRVLSPAGRTFQVEEDRQIGPDIFDRDATDNHDVVDVAKANGDVRRVVRAPPP